MPAHAEARQHPGGAGLERVAIVRGDHILQKGDASRVGMAVFADPSLLAQGFPHHRVAAHGQLENDGIVVEEAVLPKHAEACPLGQPEAAVRDLLVTGQEAQEGRLARAVGAHEPVARPRIELQGHVFEQHARAVFLGQVAGIDHAGRGRVAPSRVIRFEMPTPAPRCRA